MVGIFDCGGVLGKYEIRLKERKVVNMEALNTYKTEKTLAEQMNERLAEMKMTKAEAALKMNYSRAALSQYVEVFSILFTFGVVKSVVVLYL